MTGGASPARRVALRVVRRVFEEGAYADRALAAEAGRARLDGRERSLAMALAFGAVQRVRTLDWHVERLSDRRVEKLDPAVRAVLRLGLLQLHYLGGVAQHAAVHETVELAKEAAPRAAGLVNAVLRRASREVWPELPDGTAREAALAHSVPDWLAEMWWEELGGEEACALLRMVNDAPEGALRVNSLVPADLSAVPAHPASEPPRRSCSTVRGTPGAARSGGRERSTGSRGPPCSWRERWRPSRGSACSTSAPHRAGRPRTSRP
jgi:16S rRNA (cytosine967-C5)-methyltransferase